MTRSRVTRVALMAAGLALAATGCGMKAAAQMCQQSGGAEFCLTEKGPAFLTTGRGFQPGAEVFESIDDAAPSSRMRAGDGGEFPPPEGLTLVSRGPVAQRLTITGTSSTGEEVRFEFTVPPADG